MGGLKIEIKSKKSKTKKHCRGQFVVMLTFDS
jgi:hypothetical protein